MDTRGSEMARTASRAATLVFAIPTGLLALFLANHVAYWGPLLFSLFYVLREILLSAADSDRNLDRVADPLRAAKFRLTGGAIYIGLFALVGALVGQSFNESHFIVAFTVTALGLVTVQNLRYGQIRVVSDDPPPSAYYGRTTYDVSPVEEYEEVEYFRIRFRRRRRRR